LKASNQNNEEAKVRGLTKNEKGGERGRGGANNKGGDGISFHNKGNKGTTKGIEKRGRGAKVNCAEGEYVMGNLRAKDATRTDQSGTKKGQSLLRDRAKAT